MKRRTRAARKRGGKKVRGRTAAHRGANGVPGIDNPFEYDAPMTVYEGFKMAFFLLTGIAIIRVVVFLSLVFIAYICARIATIGIDKEVSVYSKPFSKWRRIVLAPVCVLCRMSLFLFGFYRIKVVGVISPTACIITPNHVSMFDLLAMYWLSLPSALSKAETLKLPIIGTVFRALQVIPVRRELAEDRQHAKDMIKKYADSREHETDESKRFPPILVFPQGTTTKQTSLTMFQRGAFSPGQPVQPVVLRYKWKHFDPAYVVTRKTDYFIFRHLTQFVMNLEIQFLDPYYPSKAEKEDATLFAHNVRALIAEKLGATTTNHSFEDGMLYRCAINAEETDKDNKPIDLKGVELKRIKDLFGIDPMDESKRFTLKDAKKALEKFVQADTNGDGIIDYHEFSRALGYEPCDKQTKRLFDFFDIDGSGEIDFREMITGIAMCSPYSTSEEKVRFAFDIYDTNGDGVVSESELRSLLRFVSERVPAEHLEETEKQMDELVKYSSRNDKHGERVVTWESFRQRVPKDSLLIRTAISTVDEQQAKKADGNLFFPTPDPAK